MTVLSEAIQISIICIGIVFASLLVFCFLIQLMGSYFQKSAIRETRSTSNDRKKVAAIITAFHEEFGDQIAEIKISRVK
ncbi:MAG: hypothetical protein KAX49_08125 [Halanaerobiales bacterium]|nr:hypothetical protein [Halanaerobiales bacterium]